VTVGQTAQVDFTSGPADDRPPVSSATRTPPANAAGWNDRSVTVGLTAEDDAGGTGVQEIHWQLAGAQIGKGVLPAEGGDVDVTAAGITTLTYFAVDKAGNEEAARTLTIRIDRLAPETTAKRTPAPNAAGWNAEDVTVDLSAVDAGESGVDEVRFELDGAETRAGALPAGGGAVTVRSEGVTTLAYWAVDVAGNAEARRTLTVRIDRTAPKLSAVPSPATLWPPNGKLVPVIVRVDADDALSGVDSWKLVSIRSDEPASGDIVGFLVGTRDVTGSLRAERNGSGDGRVYTLEFRATDAAGNATTAFARVTVPHDRGNHDGDA
jgi:hypothetical protein